MKSFLDGFPSFVRKKMLKGFKESDERKSIPRSDDRNPDDVEDELSLTLKLPYMGAEGDELLQTLQRKVQLNLSQRVHFKIYYTASQIAMFCCKKDKIPIYHS